MEKKKYLIIIPLIIIILSISGLILGKYAVKIGKNIKLDNSLKLNIDSKTVTNLYRSVNPSTDANIIKGLYQPEFSNDYILSVGIVNYLQDNNLKNEQYIDKKEVDRYIHKILGYNHKYNHQTVYILNAELGICGYWYNTNTNKYELIPGCGGNTTEYFYRKITDAKYVGDTIEITEKSIYQYTNWNDTTNEIYIYNNINKEKLLDYINPIPTNYYINIDKYLEEATTYVYTFKLQYDDYLLKDIKKIW